RRARADLGRALSRFPRAAPRARMAGPRRAGDARVDRGRNGRRGPLSIAREGARRDGEARESARHRPDREALKHGHRGGTNANGTPERLAPSHASYQSKKCIGWPSEARSHGEKPPPSAVRSCQTWPAAGPETTSQSRSPNPSSQRGTAPSTCDAPDAV